MKTEVRGSVENSGATTQLLILRQSELLVNHLFSRMSRHLETRFTDTKYWSHWCFRWARRQFTRVALMCCTVGHVKQDLEAMHASDCLLSLMTTAFIVVEPEEESTLEGSYVIYDAVNAKFVRSGKASPVSIAERFEGHKKESKTSEKGFYGRYPHKSNPNIRTKIRRGFFDQLQLFCALGFDRNNIARLVDTTESGIFEWDAATLNSIKDWKFTGTETDKRLTLVAYLFELVYDLMIAPGDNVSMNGGFEQCHGHVSSD